MQAVNMDLFSNHGFSKATLVILLICSASITGGSGCEIKELGMKVPNSHRIPDRYVTSSSQLSAGYAASRGRIGVMTTGPFGDGWCAAKSDSAPYIQVFFEFLTIVTVIETEGVLLDGNQTWVEIYSVSVSNDSVNFTPLQEKGNATKFEAINSSFQGIWGHHLRINPETSHGEVKCMRIALYGCDDGAITKTLGTVSGTTPVPSLEDELKDAPFASSPLEETLLLVIPIVVSGCVIIAGLLCLFCCRRFKRARQKKHLAEDTTDMGPEKVNNGVIYEEPPPYEFQTVSLEFGHDPQDKNYGVDGKAIFKDENKIFSFGREAVVEYA